MPDQPVRDVEGREKGEESHQGQRLHHGVEIASQQLHERQAEEAVVTVDAAVIGAVGLKAGDVHDGIGDSVDMDETAALILKDVRAVDGDSVEHGPDQRGCDPERPVPDGISSEAGEREEERAGDGGDGSQIEPVGQLLPEIGRRGVAGVKIAFVHIDPADQRNQRGGGDGVKSVENRPLHPDGGSSGCGR